MKAKHGSLLFLTTVEAAFSRELSPLEVLTFQEAYSNFTVSLVEVSSLQALLLGDGAGSEWDFEWPTSSAFVRRCLITDLQS